MAFWLAHALWELEVLSFSEILGRSLDVFYHLQLRINLNREYISVKAVFIYFVCFSAADSADSPILEEAGESGSELKPKPLVKYGELVILGYVSKTSEPNS